MKVELRQRDRRALILLGLAVVVYLGVTQAVLPAYDYLKVASATAAEKEDQLRKYRRALERKGRYEQLAPAARAQVDAAESILIRGDNASLASAELQSLIEEIAKGAEVNVSQRSVTPPRKVDEFYNEITMSLVFDATPAQVLGFLSGIRTSPKFLTLKNVQISPTQPLTEAPKTGEFRKTVRVNVMVAGLLAPAKAG